MQQGQQLANDVVDSKTKTTSNTTYTTSPLAGRDDVIVPGNATGNYKAGVTNVIYLYGKAQSGEKVLIGDVDGDGSISVQDTTLIQKHLVNLTKLETVLLQQQMLTATEASPFRTQPASRSILLRFQAQVRPVSIRTAHM